MCVCVDAPDWKAPAQSVLADTGAPVWTTGPGSSASVWMASPEPSVRNVRRHFEATSTAHLVFMNVG